MAVNQCDGCRAGKPLVKIVRGEFVKDPSGHLHVMNDKYWEDNKQYSDLMSCTKDLYEEKPDKTRSYLGDGVYVRYDGHALIVTTEDGVHVTNTIILEPHVFHSLVEYVDKLKKGAT
jgi:hypothetical protein